MTGYAIVIPTVGRASLRYLLESLAAQHGPAPDEVVLVDDRPDAAAVLPVPEGGGRPVRVLRSYGRGPAAARNRGWSAAAAPWIAFLDDDVLLPDGWCAALATDLAGCGGDVAGCQGRVVVPSPAGRRPTEAERRTGGLRHAAWATADMAYRRDVLAALGGFDERFRRAYREDSDLALRCRRAGHVLSLGRRYVVHPARDAGGWASVRAEAGNAADALMRARHGKRWRADADAPAGRFGGHVGTVAAAGLTLTGMLARRPALATLGAAAGGALVAEATARRLAAGPRPGQPGWCREALRVLATGPVLPFAAVGHRLAGTWRYRNTGPWPPPVRAVLFDRDGTLIHDVPYNGDPDRVRPVEGAAEALDRLRRAGIRTGVITNQSALGRGLLGRAAVRAVNSRVETELGPFDTWQVCPHRPQDRCACRKPMPGLVLRAAAALGVPAEECVVVGDIGADMEAAVAAGARGVLVPNEATRPGEILDAPVAVTRLADAVDLLLGPAGDPAGLSVPAGDRGSAAA